MQWGTQKNSSRGCCQNIRETNKAVCRQPCSGPRRATPCSNVAAPSIPTHSFIWCNMYLNLLITDVQGRMQLSCLLSSCPPWPTNPQLSSLYVQYSQWAPAPCPHLWQTPNHTGTLNAEGGAILKDTIDEPTLSVPGVRYFHIPIRPSAGRFS